MIFIIIGIVGARAKIVLREFRFFFFFCQLEQLMVDYPRQSMAWMCIRIVRQRIYYIHLEF